jgi:hypothetical protein
MTLLICILVGLTLAGFIGTNAITSNEKKKEKKRKYVIPVCFWDDYNHVTKAIYNMTIKDCDRVESMIDDLIYKYHEMIDYVTFVEKISNLVSSYNNRVKFFLLNQQLNSN